MNKNAGWIGVDLDGTLAEYSGWVDALHIGSPIPRMVGRIKKLLAKGVEVRIFTARVTPFIADSGDLNRHSVETITRVIQDYCELHIGARLKVTNMKDFGMVELWDDRAVGVVENEGIVKMPPLEELESRLMALTVSFAEECQKSKLTAEELAQGYIKRISSL